MHLGIFFVFTIPCRKINSLIMQHDSFSFPSVSLFTGPQYQPRLHFFLLRPPPPAPPQPGGPLWSLSIRTSTAAPSLHHIHAADNRLRYVKSPARTVFPVWSKFLLISSLTSMNILRWGALNRRVAVAPLGAHQGYTGHFPRPILLIDSALLFNYYLFRTSLKQKRPPDGAIPRHPKI